MGNIKKNDYKQQMEPKQSMRHHKANLVEFRCAKKIYSSLSQMRIKTPWQQK